MQFNAARTDLCGKTACLNWNNQKTQSPMNATTCPQKQNMEQSQNTISKKCMQDQIHRRKMSTALLSMHTDPFTHRAFYTQKLLHTEAFTFTHRGFYTQTPLHTDAFTHRRFYIQTLLHTDPFTHRSFYTQNHIFTLVFDVQRPFRAKGSRWAK